MTSVRWLAAIVFVFIWTLTTHGKFSASGDEPHYLMITHSIVHDGDLDLSNDYATDGGSEFGHEGLGRGLHALPDRQGRIMSIHDIGLGVALVPPYVVAQVIARVPSESLLRRFRMNRGLFAYSIMGLFLIGLTTWGVTLVARGLASLAPERDAVLLVLLAAVSPPIASHAFLVFPEVLALFATCTVVWFALKQPSPADTRALLLIALILGVLPWMHHKYLLYVPGLAVLIALTRWPAVRAMSWRAIAAAVLLFVLPQLALHVWTWETWGTLGGALTTERVPFALETFRAGAVGLWVDRQSGLLAYAPMYWVLPACLLLAWKRAWPFLIPAALLYLPAAAFVTGWWAGFAPAARYLVPAMPLLLVPIAASLESRVVRTALIALSIPQIAIDLIAWQHPRALWPTADVNPALERAGSIGRVYERFLPPVQSMGASGAVWAGVTALIMTGILVALTMQGIRRRPAAVQQP